MTARRGRPPEEHYVEGRWVTVAKAAKELGMTSNALRLRMLHHNYDLAAAVKDVRLERKLKAVKEILAILKEKPK